MKTSRSIAIVLLSITLVGLLGGVAEAAKSSMPPTAKAEYDLGNAAFDQRDWDSAIKHFDEARKFDERNPRILFNLGLSHSKASHELPAIAWLEAYLVLMPNDPKLAEIRKEITRLTAAAEGKVAKMLKTAQDACDQLQENDSWGEEEKHYILQSLAMAYLLSGNATKAVTTADQAGPQLGLGRTAEEALYIDSALFLIEGRDSHPERTDPDAACEALGRCTEALRRAAEGPFAIDYWVDVCEAYHGRADWGGLRRAALRVVSQDEQQKWLDLADKKEAPYKGDSCGNWIALAEDLSADARFVDLERSLKTTTDKDTFWTWTPEKGIRSVDITWHVIKTAKEWSIRLRHAKSIRKLVADTAPRV